jgi:hypothetical protein
MTSRGFQVSVTGAKCYVAGNQLRSGGRKRTERCIAKVRHLYGDLETDCDTHLTSLRASEAFLPLTAVTSISPGKYQVRWWIDCSPFERQESTLKLLCIVFRRDPVCTNVNRIPRPPGSLSCKYDTTYSIAVEYPSDSTWNLDDFRLDIAAANTILLSCLIPWQKHSGKHTNSDHDWAGLWRHSAHGNTSGKSATLASLRADLPQLSFTAPSGQSMPQSAKLWLIGGIPIDDRVTVFEARRRFEIPTAPCFAPRREVAFTPQRLPGERLFDFVAYIRRISATT